RASKGLLLTTHGQSNAQGQQMDASPAKDSLNNSIQQMQSLSDSAKNQNADPLSAIDKLKSCIDALEAQGDDAKVKAFKQAILLLTSPADIALTTPKNIHSHAGENITKSAGESINQSAGKNYTLVAGQGISLYTADHGAKLFAAKGKVQLQAQSDAMELIASLGLKIISTQDSVEITASKNITLTAGGSQIKIGGEGITLTSPSPINYKAAQHVFAGGARVNVQLPNLPTSYAGHFQVLTEGAGIAAVGAKYIMTLPNGQKIFGTTDSEGKTLLAYTDSPKPIDLQILADESWYQPEPLIEYVDGDNFDEPFVEEGDYYDHSEA
ncbi:MAG: DUF2345 domain-containing protein, partial [Legionellales bacterium]